MAEELELAQDAGAAAQDDAGKTFDAAYVAKLRQEAANYRVKYQEAKTQVDALAPKAQEFDKLAESQKSDQQKLTEQLATLQQQVATAQQQAQAAQAQANLLRLAAKAGVDPDVANMLDITKLDLSDDAKAIEALGKFAAKTPSASQVKPGTIGGATEAELRAQYFGGKSKTMIFGG